MNRRSRSVTNPRLEWEGFHSWSYDDESRLVEQFRSPVESQRPRMESLQQLAGPFTSSILHIRTEAARDRLSRAPEYLMSQPFFVDEQTLSELDIMKGESM